MVIWGFSLPFNRYMASIIGIPALIGTSFFLTGILSLANQRRLGQGWPDAAIFRSKILYLRWLLFFLTPLGVWTAAFIVQKQHLPIVILINYLWPTGIILFSLLIAGVTVTRAWAFLGGTAIVLAALCIEIVQPGTLGDGIFASRTDCAAYALSLLSAFSWSLYTALTRRSGTQPSGPSMVPYFLLTLGLVLPFSFLPRFYEWNHLTFAVGAMLIGWCFLQFLAHLTWDYGTRNGNVVILSLCADFIPWLSLAVSHMLIGVEIGGKTMLAAFLLVLGAMTTRYGTLAKRRVEAQLEQLAQEHSPAD